MNRSRAITLSLVVAGFGAASALACNDRSPESTPIVQPAASEVRRAVPVAAVEAMHADAKRSFHRQNRSDWVGRAHNQAIDEFRARLRRGEISHDLCKDLATFMSDEVRLPNELRQRSGTRAQRRQVAARWLQSSAFCVGRSGNGTGVPVRLAQSTSDLSPQTRAMLNEVQSAAARARSSGELAISLSAITQGSAQLPNGESAIVDATASVAQSSMEYWEANLTATQQDYDRAYSGCVRSAPSAAVAANSCLGLSGVRVAPTNFRDGTPMQLYFTQGAQSNCPKIKGKDVVQDDVKGAIGGAAVSAWGGAAVIPGALVGAAAGSISSFGWQWAETTWCVLSARQGRPNQT